MLAWDERMSVQVRELDDQHKKLIKMVGDLHQAMREGRGQQELSKILNGLISYTITHFAAEERLMQTHGYPEYEAHRQIHEKMTQKVKALQQEYQAGKRGLSLDVMKFLEDWVAKHIMGTDKKYGPFLNSKGVQ